MELEGKLKVKAKNGKGFLLEGHENWFNALGEAVGQLAQLTVGEKVTISYTKNGIKQEVTKISVATVTKTESNSSTGFVCEVCGVALKDGKYKKCFMCNKKEGYKPKTETSKEVESEPVVRKDKPYYNSEDRTAQIMRGNSINAAGAAVAGNLTGSDPETIAQAVKLIAQELLDWLKAE